MAIDTRTNVSIRTENNFFVLEQKDAPGGNVLERILFHPAAPITYSDLSDQGTSPNVANDGVSFQLITEQPDRSIPAGDGGENLPVNLKFLRTNLLDGNAGDAAITTMQRLRDLLSPLLGAGFNAAASTGPGTPISQTEIAQFDDTTYTSSNTFVLIPNTNTPIPNDGAATANPKSIDGKSLTYDANTQLFELSEGQELTGTLQVTLVAPLPNTFVRFFLDVGGNRAWDHRVDLRQAGAIVTQSIPYKFVAGSEWNTNSGQLIAFSNRATEVYDIKYPTETSQ